jgi:hypothetical protein
MAGALVLTRKSGLNNVRVACQEMGWLKSGINVTPFSDQVLQGETNLAAIHLNLRGVKAMEALSACQEGVVPQNIAQLLSDTSSRFIPGLRVGSPACFCESSEGRRRRRDSKDAAERSTEESTLHPAKRDRIAEQSACAGFTFSELFAGIGGFRVALEELGGRSVFASEIDPEARAVYRRNFGDDGVLVGDIYEVEASSIGPHDLLTGGYTCQTFSVMGQGEGFADLKGVLFLEIVRVLRSAKPRVGGKGGGRGCVRGEFGVEACNHDPPKST